jgi:hypothetical protein
MRSSKKAIPLAATVLVAGLMVFVFASGPVEAAPAVPAVSPAGTWSYGVVKTLSVAPTLASGDWYYEGNATFGYTVTVYENSTSASGIELTIFRTMGVSYNVEFCQSSCSHPTQWSNQSYRLWESTTSFTNLTTAGSVDENGTAVPAVAVVNSTAFLRANLTESSNTFLPTAGQKGPHLRYLGASLSGHSTVEFTPALGLFPDSLESGSTWNSSSDFSESGGAAYSYFYSVHAPAGGYVRGPVSGTVEISSNGSVSLQGEFAPGSTVSLGGESYPAIVLTLTGPFAVREGVIFVPDPVDLFGTSDQPWATNQTGTSTAQMATLDIQPGERGGGLFHLVASSWHVGTQAANAAQPSVMGSSSDGIAPAVASGSSVATETLQGVPETSSQSGQDQQCLIAGSGCPSLSSSGTTPHPWLSVLVIVGVVVVVGVLVALVAVSSRRRLPPPAYPNASLYPPGVAASTGPARAPATPTPPPPAEEDPLDHLW